MSKKSTSWAIDPDKLKARIILEGLTCKEASIMTHHCPQWISICLHSGKMSEEGIRLIEEEIGIKRRFYVIRKID